MEPAVKEVEEIQADDEAPPEVVAEAVVVKKKRKKSRKIPKAEGC